MAKATIGTVRYFLRTDKIKKDGTAPIELIYSLHGQRKYINTGHSVFPFLWDSDKSAVLYFSKAEAKKLFPEYNYNDFPTAADAQELNAAIVAWSQKVADAETLLKSLGAPFTSEDIKERLKVVKQKVSFTVKADPKHYLSDFITEYIETIRPSRNPGTLKVYGSTLNHLKTYQKINGLKVSIADAGFGFLQSFHNFLIEHVKHLNVTASKQTTTIKTFLSVARKHGYSINPTFHDFTVKREDLEVIALTQDEFNAVYALDLSKNKRLEQVRDVFCFSCVTGLRFSDLLQLRREHLKDGYIRLTVTKTKEILEIPLTSYSKTILHRYSDKIIPLPVISNQKTNAYIKEVCKMAEVTESVEIIRYRGAERIREVMPKYKLVSAHTGRKTFVTLSLEKGLNAEEVMSITAHKSYASFKRYVKITNERKKSVMNKAWDTSLILKEAK